MAEAVQMTETGATVRAVEKRFNAFRNKNTFWHHDQDGTMDAFDRAYEEAVAKVRGQLGATLPLVIGGSEVTRDATFAVASPAASGLVVGRYASGSKEDVRHAVEAARAAFPAWAATPWQERADILDRAADLFTKHFYELCAVMTFETGKTRYEASIDVDEAIDFLRFYALTMREWDGFDMVMGKPVPQESCRSIRKPRGVFGVFCPFNFPIAITTGMAAAALVTGNAVVLKPSMKGCLAGWWVFRLLKQAGVPDGALHFLTGPDEEVSAGLMQDPGVDGIVFTGSARIGHKALAEAARRPAPIQVITEMGGKNAVYVSDKADLDTAIQGVFKAAFGFSGQKCSACSRVYVHKDVAGVFVERLGKLTERARVGEPWSKENYMGPVIEARKAELFDEVVAQVRKDGGTIVAGGERAGKGGHYVRPTVVTGLPLGHRVFREEFFMPFVAVAPVSSLDEALEQANAVPYGLTSGVMSTDEAEVDAWFDGVEAGVVYANRASGACTAAVVNGQSFGGWKDSGNTGHGAGGRYYLLQFTREQSQTRVA